MKRKNKEYALYKGDELLAIGTLKELAEKFKIREDSLLFYGSPTYTKRTNGKNSRRLVRC